MNLYLREAPSLSLRAFAASREKEVELAQRRRGAEKEESAHAAAINLCASAPLRESVLPFTRSREDAKIFISRRAAGEF